MKNVVKRNLFRKRFLACILTVLMLLSVIPVSVLAANDMTIYFAVPAEWSDYDEVRINIKYGGGSDERYPATMTDTGFSQNSLKVYSIELDSSAVFKWHGYHKVQFQAYKNGAWKAQVEYNSSETWRTDQASWNGMIFYNGEWVTYTPDVVEDTAKTVYFDASYSKFGVMRYDLGTSVEYYRDRQTEANKCLIPNPDVGKVYYYANGSRGNRSGEMTRVGSSDVYMVELPEGYSARIVFSSTELTSLEGNHKRGGSTTVLNVPADGGTCFFADANDYIIYNEDFNGGYRGGYWGTYGELRNAETGKSTDIVDISTGTFTRDANTYYIKTSLYDYYSDYELSGYNLDTRAGHDNNAFRRWYSFRIFDTALSNKYRSLNSESVVPLYTGQFQPDYSDWGYVYSSISSVFPLYGTDQMNCFMSVNNSALNADGEGTYFDSAALGLVYHRLNGGDVKVKGAMSNVLPYFDSGFLAGNNSYNAVIGETYYNVAFPLQEKQSTT